MRRRYKHQMKSWNIYCLTVFKVFMILYLLLFSVSSLTANTAASFSEHLDVNGEVAIGNWASEKTDEIQEKESLSGNGEQACPEESPEKQAVKENTTEERSISKNNNSLQEGETCS